MILPSEILVAIFHRIQGSDVFALPRVCMRWRLVCRETMTIPLLRCDTYWLSSKRSSAFFTLLENFKEIASLDISEMCIRSNNIGLIEGSNSIRRLKCFNLSRCIILCDSWIIRIVKRCEQLRGAQSHRLPKNQ